MRIAVITTALAIAVLALYANQRDAKRAREQESFASETQAAPALPDVAAPPIEITGAERADSLAPEPVYTPAAQRGARTHVVAPGETLASLADRCYGDSQRAGEIYASNRHQIRDPELLHEGQTLIIP
jgi:nucleoid-associated protein YgaU